MHHVENWSYAEVGAMYFWNETIVFSRLSSRSLHAFQSNLAMNVFALQIDS